MAAPNLRDQRPLGRALDAAAEELDLPLTTRQVQALAERTAAKLADQVAAQPAVPTGFQPPTA